MPQQYQQESTAPNPILGPEPPASISTPWLRFSNKANLHPTPPPPPSPAPPRIYPIPHALNPTPQGDALFRPGSKSASRADVINSPPMTRRSTLSLFLFLAALVPPVSAATPPTLIAKSVTIYRDSYGVPHVFGPT